MRVAAVCLALGLIASAVLHSQSGRTQMLWRDPGPIGARDLFWGPGSEEHAPKPPFSFVSEDDSGTKPKVVVSDKTGMLWTAKFASESKTGSEVHSEIAASRLVWALGYFVEEHYYVPKGTISGVQGVLRKRTAAAIAPDGSFKESRFEREPPEIDRGPRWDLEDNPFAGSRELSGLKMMAMLLNNWDARPGNTRILRVPVADGIEERFVLSDLGTAFGKIAGRPTRWNLTDYKNSDFIRGIVGDSLVFCHGLDMQPPLSVPLDHARWFSQLASQLTATQVRKALEASGAKRREIEGFSKVVLAKIEQLREAIDGRPAAACIESPPLLNP
jgi:hypothetical protein